MGSVFQIGFGGFLPAGTDGAVVKLMGSDEVRGRGAVQLTTKSREQPWTQRLEPVTMHGHVLMWRR